MVSSALHKTIIALQWDQLKHDEVYHKDITILPISQRIQHMALHNAKYTSYFFNAVDNGDSMKMEKALIDAFVITLASANTLRQDIGSDLSTLYTDLLNVNSLYDLGRYLAQSFQYDAQDTFFFLRLFIQYNGDLAKACESLDHLEEMSFQKHMSQANLGLFKAVVMETTNRDIDIVKQYYNRIDQIESRSIFSRQYRMALGDDS